MAFYLLMYMSPFLFDISWFSINPLYTAQLTTFTSQTISINSAEQVAGCFVYHTLSGVKLFFV